MRQDLNCAYAIQAVGPRSTSSDAGFYLYLTEQYNTCQTVDSSSTSGGSKVFLSWCTIPVAGSPGVYSLYRENLLGSGSPTSTCDSSGTLEASDLVAPPAGWPTNARSATPSTWNGNIWPTSLITCPSAQTNYLPTVGVDMAVNPDPGEPAERDLRAEGSAHAPERDTVRHGRHRRRDGHDVLRFSANTLLADGRLELHCDSHGPARRRRNRHDLRRDEDDHVQRAFQLALRQFACLSGHRDLHERRRYGHDNPLQRCLHNPQRHRRHEDGK